MSCEIPTPPQVVGADLIWLPNSCSWRVVPTAQITPKSELKQGIEVAKEGINAAENVQNWEQVVLYLGLAALVLILVVVPWLESRRKDKKRDDKHSEDQEELTKRLDRLEHGINGFEGNEVLSDYIKRLNRKTDKNEKMLLALCKKNKVDSIDFEI